MPYNYIFDSLALLGGHFGALRVIIGFFLSLWVGDLFRLQILQDLFLFDTNKARKP